MGCDSDEATDYVDLAVSIHAPTWGATPCRYASNSAGLFQSTHPHGVRLDGAQYCAQAAAFQSTHPHGVRPDNREGCCLHRLCFNPRTHMGCDSRPPPVERRGAVSIHAPTWGATYRLPRMPPPLRFNPRTHMGCDDRGPCRGVHHVVVSIHAPTWGATRRWRCCRRIADSFNPRTHMGCDGKANNDKRARYVSIHAPTWGATLVTQRKVLAVKVSIHAPTWGATSDTKAEHTLSTVSIHAPTWGATCPPD